MVVLWENPRKTIGKWWLYPLVNVNKKLWKDPPCLMGKSTISMAIFHSYVSLPKGIYHWIGLEIYRKPWFLPSKSIKHRAFRLNFSHNPVLYESIKKVVILW